MEPVAGHWSHLSGYRPGKLVEADTYNLHEAMGVIKVCWLHLEERGFILRGTIVEYTHGREDAMIDTQAIPPTLLTQIEEATRATDFTMQSDTLTGALLRMLAASKPEGNFLELGTGTGMGTAWMLDGMDTASRLVTVDKNERYNAIARRFLSRDTRVTFHTGDGEAFIRTQQAGTFDLIFADMPPGKFQLLDETLALLRPGGLYIIDDLSPLESWEPAHAPRVTALIATLEQRSDLRICKLNWSTGLLIATRIA